MARKIESPSREVEEALGKYLDDAISDLRQVIYGFPESNRNLKYPCLAVTASPDSYENFYPYVLSQDDVQNSKANVRYVVGQFNWSIQLDLWERTKEERHDIFQKLHLAMNPGIPQLTGLHLNLENYHNVLCSYEITNYSFEDDEIGSQRKEWRAIVDVAANCKAIVDKDEFIIEETEVQLETPDEIPAS